VDGPPSKITAKKRDSIMTKVKFGPFAFAFAGTVGVGAMALLFVASLLFGIAFAMVLSWCLTSGVWWIAELWSGENFPDQYFWPIVGIMALLGMVFSR